MLKYIKAFFRHLECRFSGKICICHTDRGNIAIINSITKV